MMLYKKMKAMMVPSFDTDTDFFDIAIWIL